MAMLVSGSVGFFFNDFFRDPHISGTPGPHKWDPYHDSHTNQGILGMGVGLGSSMGGWGSHYGGVPGISLETNVGPKKGTVFLQKEIVSYQPPIFPGDIR